MKMIFKRDLTTDEGLLYHILVILMYTKFQLIFALISLENDAFQNIVYCKAI